MTYSMLLCDLGLFGAVILAAVLLVLLLRVFVYGVICCLAWIEDEIGRAIQRRRRKKRLLERARRYKAGARP